tara:strand:- start:804 stop:1154 length:351 start_codon:yes stop_codon:yes gene_type:complete
MSLSNLNPIEIKDFYSGLKELFFIFILVLILITCLDYTHWNGIDKDEDSNLFDKILNRIYFLSSSVSTTGYGDISPKSRVAKIIVIIIQIYVTINVATLIHNYLNKSFILKNMIRK